MMLQSTELPVHLVHEAVKVAPAHECARQACAEQIHQPGLAAAHAAPDVEPLHRGRRSTAHECTEPARKRQPARWRRRQNPLAQILQPSQDGELGIIAVEMAGQELRAVQLPQLRGARDALGLRGEPARG